MKKEIRWSPYPREAYTILLGDDQKTRMGLGAHPVLDVVPGAWNIFWLTFAPLDQMAYYTGELKSYIVNCDALAICTSAAMQMSPAPNEAMTFGELAVTMQPKSFIDLVIPVATFLPFVYYGEEWIKKARLRAEKVKPIFDNVIQVDFRKKERKL